jgi:hypothetical protein
MNQTAHRLGLEATLRPIGRPRKPTTKPPSLFDDDQETE